MNALDVLRYGHQTVHATIDHVPTEEWDVPGACGRWSIKNIVAHLASFEQVLTSLLTEFVHGDPRSFHNPFTADFNDTQVDQRAQLSPAATLAEYDAAHAHVIDLIGALEPETIRQPGTLPWYGAEYALDDFLVYTYYGHKREHCGQIAVFRSRPSPHLIHRA